MTHPRVLAAAALLVVLGVHAAHLGGGFTWLDHGDLEGRRAVRPLAELPRALVTPLGETAFYRPLVTVLNSLDAALWGRHAAGYHATNLLLHLAAALAAPLFLAAFVPLDQRQRLLVFLLFGVHPVSFLPVGALAYRSESLLALFLFLALHTYARARTEGGRVACAAALLFGALALLSKETALYLLPALVGLYELRRRARGERRFSLAAAGLALLGTYLLLRHHAVPETWRTPPLSLPLVETAGTHLAALARLLPSLVLPLLPALSDATTVVSLGGPRALAAILLLALCALAVVAALRRSASEAWLPPALLGLLLAPALGLVPLPRLGSPHYAYLPVIALCAAVAMLAALARRWAWPLRAALAVALAGWILWAGASAARGGLRFRSDATLFGPEVERDPRFAEGHQYLGDHHLARGELQRAAAHYEAALAVRPNVIAFVDRVAVAINLAGVRLQQGRHAEARRLLADAAAVARPSQRSLLAYDLALLAAARGAHEEVVALLGGHEWGRPEPLLLLARSLHHLGRRAEAATALRRALPLLEPERRARLQRLLGAP